MAHNASCKLCLFKENVSLFEDRVRENLNTTFSPDNICESCSTDLFYAYGVDVKQDGDWKIDTMDQDASAASSSASPQLCESGELKTFLNVTENNLGENAAIRPSTVVFGVDFNLQMPRNLGTGGNRWSGNSIGSCSEESFLTENNFAAPTPSANGYFGDAFKKDTTISSDENYIFGMSKISSGYSSVTSGNETSSVLDETKDQVEGPLDEEMDIKIGIINGEGVDEKTVLDQEHVMKATAPFENLSCVEELAAPETFIKQEVSEETVTEASDEEYLPPTSAKVSEKKSKVSSGTVRKNSSKIWTCRRCLEEFESRRKLTSHSKEVHRNQDESETNSFKFDEDQGIYTCSTCSAEYQSQDQIREHISKIHEEFYTCEVCQHITKNAFNFAVHTKIHSVDDEYFYCPLCSYKTLRKTCLKTHINRVHYHKFYYTCTTCGKGFNDSVIYKEHNNEHLGIKPFVCVVCSKEFVYSRYMLTHQMRHHTVHIEGELKKTQCGICMRVFSKAATLANHIANKHNTNGEKPEKRHLCDVCGKRFRTSDKLKIHYRIHTGDKPFACRFCDKRFTKKDYLVMHERVHTGEKPYVCKTCQKCFNQAASLRIHVRGHTGERPYICHFCKGGYISRGSLNLHMKICTGIGV